MPILEFFPYIYLGLPIKISADTAFMSIVDKGGVRLPPHLMLIESMLSFGRFLSYAILVSSLETLDTFRDGPYQQSRNVALISKILCIYNYYNTNASGPFLVTLTPRGL